MNAEQRQELKVAVDRRRRELLGLISGRGRRVRCEARTWEDGRQCLNLSAPGRRFCFRHKHYGRRQRT